MTNTRTLESGLVFGELLEPIDENSDENEFLEFFHSRISKEEAVERLFWEGTDHCSSYLLTTRHGTIHSSSSQRTRFSASESSEEVIDGKQEEDNYIIMVMITCYVL